MDVLLRLVGDLAKLAAAWEREPFVSTGLGDFDDVFSVSSAEKLLRSGLPQGSLRLFRQGEQLPVQAVTRPRERDARSREPLADEEKVAAEITAGATLVLEELQSYSAEVAGFAAAVAEATGYSTYCAAFLTPGNANGVAPHYDTASVFLRQVMGAKRWRISAPVQRWPVREWSAAMEVNTEPVLDVVLKEGDCLYLPRGFVHVGEACDDLSAHLSIALKPVTWGSVIRGQLTQLLAREEFREALPPRFAHADLAALFEAKLGLLNLADVPPPTFAPVVTGPRSRPGSLLRALNRRGETSRGDG